jgi:hypothetical protein
LNKIVTGVERRKEAKAWWYKATLLFWLNKDCL